jgi:hypothetical protein
MKRRNSKTGCKIYYSLLILSYLEVRTRGSQYLQLGRLELGPPGTPKSPGTLTPRLTCR